MVEQYRKGKRTYTRWDRTTKQVTVPSRKPPRQDVPVDVQPPDPGGVVATGQVIHWGADEMVIDFLRTQEEKARVVSRVIMSPVAAKRLLSLLEKHVR